MNISVDYTFASLAVDTDGSIMQGVELLRCQIYLHADVSCRLVAVFDVKNHFHSSLRFSSTFVSRCNAAIKRGQNETRFNYAEREQGRRFDGKDTKNISYR